MNLSVVCLILRVWQGGEYLFERERKLNDAESSSAESVWKIPDKHFTANSYRYGM